MIVERIIAAYECTQCSAVFERLVHASEHMRLMHTCEAATQVEDVFDEAVATESISFWPNATEEKPAQLVSPLKASSKQRKRKRSDSGAENRK